MNRAVIESDALAALVVEGFDDATGNGLGPYATSVCMESVERVLRKLARKSGGDSVLVILASPED